MEFTVAQQRLFAASGGRPLAAGRTALLFLHGAGMDHSVWALHSRWFAYHGYNVLAPDLPGHGASAGPACISIAQLAERVVGLLDAAGLPEAVLIGHSMGALTALEAAARFPDRVAAIALIGAALQMPVNPALLETARSDLPAAAATIAQWSFGWQGALGGSALPGLWLPGLARRVIERSAPGVLAADLQACQDYADGPAAAARIACPALVVVGEFDRMAPPRQGQALAEAIPGARSVPLPRCGHMQPLEAPEALRTALLTLV